MNDDRSHPPTGRTWKGDAREMQALRQELWERMSVDVPVKRLQHRVKLIDVGSERRSIIFELRDLAGISLGAARDLVESTPTDVFLSIEESAREDDVEATLNKAVERLEAVGARAEVPFEEEWSVSPMPDDVLGLFRDIELRSGWAWFAQTYSATGDSGMSDWLLPPNATPWQQQSQLLRGDRPVGACPMEEAITGNGSARSYLEASLLIRDTTGIELDGDAGAWYSHRLVGEPTDEDWVWSRDDVSPNSDLSPSVTMTESGDVTVRFYTVTRLNLVRLVRHCDCYRPGTYCPKTEAVVCATGGRGYVH
ncbi:MAG: hypothetical protein AAGJ40_06990 [Planctomycetota bacterium]